jgi:Ser/Thr protein kinase RdoA (MazF antagonist)
MIDLLDLAHTWHLGPLLSTCTPATGTIHHTLLLTTSEGTYVLRKYRSTTADRQRIVYEHALMQYVQSQGLPGRRAGAFTCRRDDP